MSLASTISLLDESQTYGTIVCDLERRKPVAAISLILEAKETIALKAHAKSCARERALEQAAHILLKEGIHFEKKREAVLPADRTRLEPVAEEKPG